MISQLDRAPRERARERSKSISPGSPPSKAALIHALNDLRRAEEYGEIPNREADLLVRYLIALYMVHHLKDSSEKHFSQLYQRYTAGFWEIFSE